jgi:hypothetical protein
VHPHEKRPHTHTRVFTEASVATVFPFHGLTSTAAFTEVSCDSPIIRSLFRVLRKKWLLREGIMGNQFKQRFKVTDVMMFF